MTANFGCLLVRLRAILKRCGQVSVTLKSVSLFFPCPIHIFSLGCLGFSHRLIVRERDEEEEEADEGERDDSAWHLVPLSGKMLAKWFSSQVLQNHVIAGAHERKRERMAGGRHAKLGLVC